MASDATPKFRVVIVHDKAIWAKCWRTWARSRIRQRIGRNNLLQKKIGDYTGVGIVTNARLDERQLWAMFGIAKHLQEQLAPVPLFVSSNRRT